MDNNFAEFDVVYTGDRQSKKRKICFDGTLCMQKEPPLITLRDSNSKKVFSSTTLKSLKDLDSEAIFPVDINLGHFQITVEGFKSQDSPCFYDSENFIGKKSTFKRFKASKAIERRSLVISEGLQPCPIEASASSGLSNERPTNASKFIHPSIDTSLLRLMQPHQVSAAMFLLKILSWQDPLRKQAENEQIKTMVETSAAPDFASSCSSSDDDIWSQQDSSTAPRNHNRTDENIKGAILADSMGLGTHS